MENPRIPSTKALEKGAEMSISLDKPLFLDYYIASLCKECKIAKDGTEGDKFLYKNPEEYTSPLKSMFKIGGIPGNPDDYILETQNSIYLVSGAML